MYIIKLILYLKQNKKVLRERKRHTARRVASARYAALCNGGVPRVEGYPISGLGGGVPHLRCGVPWVPPTIQTWLGVPHLR